MSSTITALTSSGGLAMAGDTSGQLQLLTNNGTAAVTIDTSQNVGIGTASPASFDATGRKLVVGTGSGDQGMTIYSGSSNGNLFFASGTTGAQAYNGYIQYNQSSNAMLFGTVGAERMRINSSGQLLFATSSVIDSTYTMQLAVATANGFITQPTTNKTYNAAGFRNSSNSEVGYISCTASATSFGTSSDYRLKHDIAPMTNGLEKVAKLKPVIYKWNVDGSDGEGFIAHELQEVCPLAVTGEKDAVNEDGTIKAQGIDTSFLVATLTAAIQELSAKVTALEEQVINLGVK